MHAPQIIMIVLFATALTISVMEGEKKGIGDVITTVISIALQSAILWWGGFWK